MWDVENRGAIGHSSSSHVTTASGSEVHLFTEQKPFLEAAAGLSSGPIGYDWSRAHVMW